MFLRVTPTVRGIAAAGIACALLVAGCSSTSNKPAAGGQAQQGGSVSVAMKTATWILPISAPGKTQGENGIFRSRAPRATPS